MKKDGFTLLELLAVVTIVAVVGIGSVISFSNIEKDTSTDELKNIYIEIQRAANLYLDLHNSDLEWFIKNKNIYYKIEELRNENYIDSKTVNPVTNEPINGNYYVKLYIKSSLDEVSSCIIDRNDHNRCISNERGESEHCCE